MLTSFNFPASVQFQNLRGNPHITFLTQVLYPFIQNAIGYAAATLRRACNQISEPAAIIQTGPSKNARTTSWGHSQSWDVENSTNRTTSFGVHRSGEPTDRENSPESAAQSQCSQIIPAERGLSTKPEASQEVEKKPKKLTLNEVRALYYRRTRETASSSESESRQLPALNDPAVQEIMHNLVLTDGRRRVYRIADKSAAKSTHKADSLFAQGESSTASSDDRGGELTKPPSTRGENSIRYEDPLTEDRFDSSTYRSMSEGTALDRMIGPQITQGETINTSLLTHSQDRRRGKQQCIPGANELSLDPR